MRDENFHRRMKCFWCIACLAWMALGIAQMFHIDGLKKQAIEHNAAHYNPTTGEFEWIERDPNGDKLQSD